MRYLKGIVNIDGSKYNLDIVEKNNKLYRNNTELQLTDLPLELLESNLIAGTYHLKKFGLENIYFNAIKYGEIDSNVEIEVPAEVGVIH